MSFNERSRCGPKVVSMMEIAGDPEELRERSRAINEVAQRKAAEYGGISSTVVKTDDGVMIINMWATRRAGTGSATTPRSVRRSRTPVHGRPARRATRSSSTAECRSARSRNLVPVCYKGDSPLRAGRRR
jgi:hypothetical protein